MLGFATGFFSFLFRRGRERVSERERERERERDRQIDRQTETERDRERPRETERQREREREREREIVMNMSCVVFLLKGFPERNAIFISLESDVSKCNASFRINPSVQVIYPCTPLVCNLSRHMI